MTNLVFCLREVGGRHSGGGLAASIGTLDGEVRIGDRQAER